MATMLDYLYWRGDVPFDKMPPNELDGLVLTRFAYLPMELVAREPEETVRSIAEKVQALPAGVLRLEEDQQLLYYLEHCDRFKDLKVTDFVKDNDEDIVIQFSAVTIHLPEEQLYIAYCGTDSTLLGWKEDFYMSFMEDVPAQKAALAYAKDVCARYPERDFYLGGHSKGGNLAVYTAVNLPEDLKARLLHVSDYDGPGFPKSYIDTHDFRSVVERIDTFIPQESVFGRIHDHAEGFSVVESNERGLNQHNPYSWEVEPTGMVLLEAPDTTSDIMYTAIQNILQNTSPEQRKAYVDQAYDILTSSDFSTMKEFRNADAEQRSELRKSVTGLSEETWKKAQEVNNAMFKSLLEAVLSNLEGRVKENLLPLPGILGGSSEE